MTKKVAVIANPEPPLLLSATISFHSRVGCMLVRHRGSHAVHEDLHLLYILSVSVPDLDHVRLC